MNEESAQVNFDEFELAALSHDWCMVYKDNVLVRPYRAKCKRCGIITLSFANDTPKFAWINCKEYSMRMALK